jgi:beta-phosphoglucomutase family hydrolase
MFNIDYMLRGLLFDMDGVLVNNLEIHRQAFAEFFRRYGVERTFDELSRVFGKGNDDIMGELMPRDIVERVGIRELGCEKEAIYREIYAPIIEPQPGLLEFLADAEHEGLQCAVGSSGYRANVDFVLDKCNIERYFKAAVAGDEVTRCKPDPEIYLTAASKLGLKPEECVVFEDAEAGIESAKRAGIKVVALATTFTREFLATTDADMIIDDFRDINVDMLRKLISC